MDKYGHDFVDFTVNHVHGSLIDNVFVRKRLSFDTNHSCIFNFVDISHVATCSRWEYFFAAFLLGFS